ncbi:MAG: hypothetical protein A3H43_02485 [Gammaproteobacteria bacterium RIFCSPLOWO2_02_FULL_42_9]|nr:MAG: hypothetical protein A3H43_02485 [Gammaproteobacteria bacterium RIFCSPLOWO2_02_FULL_42_9]
MEPFKHDLVRQPIGMTIHALFEAQVKKTPNNIAVIFEDQQLTYRELNQKANQLAHYLRRQGIEPDQLLGICIDRSLEMIIGVLGILKAGGAYVPIDPAYPKERIDFMLADSGCSILLTTKGLCDFSGNTIFLDDWGKISKEPQTNPLPLAKAHHLAYVIYTSGSTGQPKGVMIEHRSLVNTIQALIVLFELSSTCRVLSFSSFSFDGFISEVFTALCSGAILILSSYYEILSSQLDILKQHAITMIIAPPSFLLTLPVESLPYLKVIASIGEICSEALVNRLAINRIFINGYGPTETAICATVKICKPHTGKPSIGKAISNVQTYVVNASGNLAQIGEAGELYIGGAGVARGYLNRPDLTAAKFIQNPFGEGRVYKTGDLVRQLENGELDYIGRIDNQVKVRGFRVELEEIEQALKQIESIKEAAIVLVDECLIAYVVGDSKDAWHTLKKQLPPQMVPSFIIELKNLPLTPNHKIDRQALQTRPLPQKTAKHLPKNKLENRLAAIWAEVLKLPIRQIERDASFFESGGHSLLIPLLLERIEFDFHVMLTPRDIFTHKNIQQLAQHIETLKPETEKSSMIPRYPERQFFPLSSHQEQIWLHQQLAGDSPLFNETANITFKEAINPADLKAALTEVIKRQSIFQVRVLNGQQTLVDLSPVHLPFIDLTTVDNQLTCAIHLATEDAKKPFNLESDPLYRFLLIQLGQKHYCLFMTFHHLMIDGITMNIFLQELYYFYQQKKGIPPLPALPIRYVDYAYWEKSQKQWRNDIQFWQKKLAELSPLNLSSKASYQANLFVGKRQPLKLSKTLTDRLIVYSKQEGVTLFTLLFAVFNVLLYRYTGQTDLAVGTVVSRRDRPELQHLAGNFLNAMIVRSDLSQHPTFSELLHRMWRELQEAFCHQAAPFQEILKSIKRSDPLPFSVSFVLSPDVGLKHWEINRLDVHTGTTKYDLTFDLEERKEGIIGRVEYRTDLFDDDFIQRMMGHYTVLLTSILDNSHQSIDHLELLTPKEKHQLLVEFNDTAVPYPKDKTIHQLFEEQVEKTPNNVAVIFEDQQLTYRELNEKANQLAHYLRKRGVEPDQLVGICLNRSLEMIIGILGILKAGGAYVPIDPDYPSARIDFILEDCQCSIILTTKRSCARIKNAIFLEEWEKLETELKTNPTNITQPHHLAYVIYTSGSTGEPKGVMIEHKSVVNHIFWFSNAFAFDSHAVVDCSSSFAFDFSVFSVLLPLVVGACMVLCDKIKKNNPMDYLDHLRVNKVSHIKLTPSYFRTLLSVQKEALQLSHLRYIVFGGEPLTTDDVTPWLNVNPACCVVNEYGPTEATVAVTSIVLNPSNTKRYGDRVPIGSPGNNVSFYVLDGQGGLSPRGVMGELYLGEVSLARGYLNRPELTAEKFIQNPFGEGRLYKTGDLVRWLPDGNLEFMGRMDDQVKIRGNRVECGEIEVRLLQQAQVQSAIVIAHTVAQNGLCLIAYLIAKKGNTIDIVELRQWIQNRLPSYMVPSYFVILDRFPLLVNGKIDKKALPDPQGICTEEPYELPRTDTEINLAALWTIILGVPEAHIGRTSNFFHLGGHSLSALQLISQIKTKWAIELNLREMYDASTLADLATRIIQKKTAIFNLLKAETSI